MTKRQSKWYAEFFDGAWDRIARSQYPLERTESELKLIVRALDVPPPARLLDLGCGFGRLAIPLAQKGYAVTGIDLSPSLLRLARQAGRRAGVRVRWLRRDMRDVPFKEYFQAAICMGVFGVLESDAEDLKVLYAARQAMAPAARLLIDIKNREFQARHYQGYSRRLDLLGGAVEEFTTEIDAGQGYRWDYETFIEADGTRRKYTLRERLYSLDELTEMLEAAGLVFLRVWGDYGGGEYRLESPAHDRAGGEGGPRGLQLKEGPGTQPGPVPFPSFSPHPVLSFGGLPARQASLRRFGLPLMDRKAVVALLPALPRRGACGLHLEHREPSMDSDQRLSPPVVLASPKI